MRSIEHGFYDPAMKARLKDLQAERERLGVNDDDAAKANLTILSHPSLHDLYRRKVEQLEAVLDSEDRTEAMEIIRSMIGCVELHPRLKGKGLYAVLHGDLAAILSACAVAKTKNAPEISLAGRQLSMVAGTGFEPVTFRL